MHADQDPHSSNENPEATAEIDPAAEVPASEAPALDPWEELEADAAKWKEMSLRTAAEMDNLRKRTTREREEAIRYANQRLLEDLIPVIDNFEMGMLAAAQDTKSMIYIGMDMVRRQLNEFLSAQGVEENRDQNGQHDADHRDGFVLARQVGGGTSLNRGRNLLHARIAGVL